MSVRMLGITVAVGLAAVAVGITARGEEDDAAREADGRVLFDFEADDAAEQWVTVNDGVMGGVSQGRFRVTDEATLEFFGKLSLKNNGGFASVRSRPAELKLKDGDALSVRVRGDGRTYYINVHVPTLRMAFSYRKPVETVEGEWREVRVPLSELVPTSFGRPVERLGPVDPERINAVGFLLADKRAGPFKLDVDWIKAVRAEAE